MLYEYKRGNKPLITHAIDLPFLNKKIIFKPGLNLIIGKNGTGKSTLINTLKKLFLVEIYGYTHLQQNDYQLLSMFGLSPKIKFTDKCLHSGIPVMGQGKKIESEYDINKDKLLLYFEERNSSKGEYESLNVDYIFSQINKLIPIKDMISNYGSNKSSELWLKWFMNNIKDLPRPNYDNVTVLLDEPTTSMDLLKKMEFWQNMKTATTDGSYQVIIATHDIGPFLLPDLHFNIIESSEGYMTEIDNHIRRSV